MLEQEVNPTVTASATPPPSSSPSPWYTALTQGAAWTWDQLGCALGNLRRSLFQSRRADYPIIVLDHAIAERAPDVPWYYAYVPTLKLPLSLEYLHDALYRIAHDPDVRGVLFLMKGPTLSLAQAQSLAALFARFRAWDRDAHGANAAPKQILVHLEQSSGPVYLAACAADRITMPPLASWDVLGLRSAPTYWRAALDRIGVVFDVVKIAPWKTAADTLTRTAMSDEARAQTTWLLDSLRADMVQAISGGRHLAAEQVAALIDQAPLSAAQALAAGLVDDVAYEDELPTLLQQRMDRPARLLPYAQARGLLRREPQPHSARRIGVMSLEGTMVVGESRTYPVPLPMVGEAMMGSNTVKQLIRAARKDSSLAAVVVHIDSGGGSALAADLIWRELSLLNQEKPVIVYMGDVAASGGYYIATAARRIVAQPATLTGSIGVVIAKGVTADLRAKIGANREVITRGENADLLSDDRLWSEAQRHKIEEMIHDVYDAFKQRVAQGRGLPYATLDNIANGRVWTGRQALAHGLVDELGDFTVALAAACRAAELPADGRTETVMIHPPTRRLTAEPGKPPVASWGRTLPQGTPQEWAAWINALAQGEWQTLLRRDPVWLIAPDLPRVE